jgi:hypothetical protein
MTTTELTKAEKSKFAFLFKCDQFRIIILYLVVAKDYTLKSILEAADKPCIGGKSEFGLPKWYDAAKYKR